MFSLQSAEISIPPCSMVMFTTVIFHLCECINNIDAQDLNSMFETSILLTFENINSNLFLHHTIALSFWIFMNTTDSASSITKPTLCSPFIQIESTLVVLTTCSPGSSANVVSESLWTALGLNDFKSTHWEYSTYSEGKCHYWLSIQLVKYYTPQKSQHKWIYYLSRYKQLISCTEIISSWHSYLVLLQSITITADWPLQCNSSSV